jgi:hypothetical protein
MGCLSVATEPRHWLTMVRAYVRLIPGSVHFWASERNIALTAFATRLITSRAEVAVACGDCGNKPK